MILRREYTNRLILIAMVCLVFIRATNMGFGYPTSEFNLAFIKYIPQKIMQAVVFLLLVFFLFINFQDTVKRVRVSRICKALILVILLSILLSPDPVLTFRFLVSTVAILLPIYLFYIYLGKYVLVETMLKLVVFIVFANIAYCIFFPEYARMTANHDGSWRGMFVHKNISGAFFAVSSIFLYSLISFTRSINRYVIYTALTASIILTIVSLSMTAILALGVGFSSFLVLSYLGIVHNKTKRAMLLVFYLISTVFLVFSISHYYETILVALGRDPTLTGRTGLWEVLLDASSQRPLLGYGVGYFHRPEVMHKFSIDFGWEAKSTHSSYLDLLLGIGGIGLSLFITFVVSILISALLNARSGSYINKLIFGLISCIISILSVGAASSGVFLGNSIHWALLAACLCVISEYESPS